MRPTVLAARRAGLLLVLLCLLAAGWPGVAGADDPPPIIPPLEPVTQWGVAAPSLNNPPVLLPEAMPQSWSSPRLTAVTIPQLPKIPQAPVLPPAAQLQPLAQFQKYSWPALQTTIPRPIEFPQFNSSWNTFASPASFNMDWQMRMMTQAAAAEARWQSEEQLMRRDLNELVKFQLDVASLAVPVLGGATGLDRAWAWLKFGASRLGMQPISTGMTFAETADAASNRSWGDVLYKVTQWGLKNTVLRTPSTQQLAGPFVSTREFEQSISGLNFNVYSQGSVQVTLQPVFAQNPTRWFAMPTGYIETTTTHWTMHESYGARPVITSPTIPQLTMPRITAPTIPSMPSIPRITVPSLPPLTMPSIPRFNPPPVLPFH